MTQMSEVARASGVLGSGGDHGQWGSYSHLIREPLFSPIQL